MKVLVIGAGSIGARHIRNLKALGHTVHVYDTNEAQYARLDVKDCWFASRLEGDWNTVLDVVLICTPASTHATIARDLLKRGYHGPLFVEKPIATALEDCEVFRSWPSPVTMVGYNWRFHPGPQCIRDEGASSVTLSCFTNMVTWPGQDYGHPLLECSHELDLALWMNGPGLLQSDQCRVINAGRGYHLSLYHDCQFTSVNLVLDAPESFRRWEVSGSYPHRIVSRRWFARDVYSLDQTYKDELAHFLQCVQEQRPTLTPFADGIYVLGWALEAIRLSEQVPA